MEDIRLRLAYRSQQRENGVYVCSSFRFWSRIGDRVEDALNQVWRGVVANHGDEGQRDVQKGVERVGSQNPDEQ